MNLTDLIQTHIKSIDAAARDATRLTRGEADLGRPASLFEARISRVDARIALLQAQRAETEKRLTAAIEEQQRLRSEMEKEAKVWAGRAPGKPGPTAPAGGPRKTAAGPGRAAAAAQKPGKPK
jgi:hypothetical protein